MNVCMRVNKYLCIYILKRLSRRTYNPVYTMRVTFFLDDLSVDFAIPPPT